jgi:hypothetical protein
MVDKIKRHHPWDQMIDSGCGWTDQLVTEWDGKAVFATVNIDGPQEQIEHVRLVFPDGSRLYLGTDGSEPVLRAVDSGAIEHWTQAEETDAYRVFTAMVKPLYDKASIKEVDTDL